MGNIANGGRIARIGELIYYHNNNDGGKLYVMHADGTGKKKLSDEEACYINVAGDFIYYSTPTNEEKLCKIRTDGTESIKLNEEKSNYINLAGEWVYYEDFNTKIQHRIRINGTDRQEVK